MRKRVLLLSLALTAQLVLPTQADDRPLIERVTTPLMEKEFQLKKGTFNDASAIGNKSANLGSTNIKLKQYETSSASGVRSFLGIKNPWFGNKTAETSPASSRLTKEARDANRDALSQQSGPETFESSTFSNSNRSAPDKEAFETRPSPLTGSAQGSVDAMQTALKEELTVEDVRKILNRSTD